MKIHKTYLYSFVLALLYITSVNSFFIYFLGYEFNPSKLIFLFLLPFIIINFNSFKFKNTDIFFLLFIFFVCLRMAFIFNLGYLTGLTNIIFPLIAYKFFQKKLDYINIKFIFYSILFIASINSVIGLVEFFTGDRLITISDLPEQDFKLLYARDYIYNPFPNLERLPQAMFNYSSVLAAFLIFPVFILAAFQKHMNNMWYYILFATLSFTVFVTFARAELLALLFIFFLRYYIVKKDVIKISRLMIIGIIGVVIISGYLLTTSDTIGTLEARKINFDMLSYIFQSPLEFIVGGDISSLESSEYGDIPHNVFIFSLYSFGVFGSFFLIGYFVLVFSNYVKFYRNHMLKAQTEFSTIFIYLLLFYFYMLFMRGFSYYILDGYQNFFLIFFVQILLELVINKFKREQSINDLHRNTIPQS